RRPRRPRATRSPYTTLFRSGCSRARSTAETASRLCKGRTVPSRAWDTGSMTTVLPAPLIADLETAGYFPQAAAHSLQLSLRDAEVLAHLARPETTFDAPEVRRHLTVLVLTRTHLLTSHLDDDPADALNPSQVVATTERIRLQRITGTGLSQVFDTDGQRIPGREAEVTLGITWNG